MKHSKQIMSSLALIVGLSMLSPVAAQADDRFAGWGGEMTAQEGEMPPAGENGEEGHQPPPPGEHGDHMPPQDEGLTQEEHMAAHEDRMPPQDEGLTQEERMAAHEDRMPPPDDGLTQEERAAVHEERFAAHIEELGLTEDQAATMTTMHNEHITLRESVRSGEITHEDFRSQMDTLRETFIADNPDIAEILQSQERPEIHRPARMERAEQITGEVRGSHRPRRPSGR
ncbi:MAG: hypothetical protein HQL54_07450 [Magnetococcales bacterium]|nr:hypothetical protein [Magnetococcales bacterium]